MAEENTNPEGVTPEEPEEVPAGDKRAVLADLAKERDKRQELEKRLEALEPLAKKAQEIEDAQKSEIERAREAATAAEERATKAEAEALRYRIATKHGISDEDATLWLTGSTEDDLTKQAERLAELQGLQAKPQQQPDPSQGARPLKPKNPWEEGRRRAQAKFGSPGN
jgi:hypothetical protein